MSYNADAFMAKAKQIDAEARRRWNAVNADTMLTQAGKVPKFQEVESWRKQQVDALQHEATLELIGDRAALRVEIEGRRKEAAKKERALLGDQIAFALAEREIAAAETDDLVNIAGGGRDEWEAEVLPRLAWLEAKRRGKGERESVARMKIQSLLVTPDAGELKRLEDEAAYLERDGERQVADLDRRAYAARLGMAVGVNPDKVE